MTDRTLRCGECGKEFVFTAAEQEFFRERGFDHEPKRCVECRRQRRRRFKSRNSRDGAPRRDSSARDSSNSAPRTREPRPRPDPESLNDAVCSSCGEKTQVPFKPDGVRPVFCMPCLKQRTR